MSTQSFVVKGLKCGGCVKRLHKALTAASGVSAASVQLESGAVTVDFDPEKNSRETLVSVIEDTGFEVVT